MYFGANSYAGVDGRVDDGHQKMKAGFLASIITTDKNWKSLSKPTTDPKHKC